jgi:hypothetical protein
VYVATGGTMYLQTDGTLQFKIGGKEIVQLAPQIVSAVTVLKGSPMHSVHGGTAAEVPSSVSVETVLTRSPMHSVHGGTAAEVPSSVSEP